MNRAASALAMAALLAAGPAGPAPAEDGGPGLSRVPQAPDGPAATPEAARERASRSIANALAEVRMLKRRLPKPLPKKKCELLEREEPWLHRPGQRPLRRMSVAAALAAGAHAMSYSWSHALPGSMLYLEVDFGPERRALTGAEWLCTLDKLTGGAVELQFYPESKHLFATEAPDTGVESYPEPRR